MNSIEKQLLAAAKEKEGAAGLGNTLGDQLMAKLRSGTGDPKLLKEELKQEMGLSPTEPVEKPPIEATVAQTIQNKPPQNKSERNHKGNGRQADRFELAAEMDEIKKIKERIKKDLARFEGDKAIVANEINEIKAHIKEAENLGESDVSKNWNARLRKAEDVLKMIEKGAPSVDPVSDETIARELHGYHRARDRQTQAELKVNRGDNPEATGEYLRAQAEAFEISQKIENLVKKRDESLAGNVANPARNEGISYTHEQATKDKEERERAHKVAPGIFGQKKEITSMQKDMDALARGNTHVTETPTLEAEPTTEVTPEAPSHMDMEVTPVEPETKPEGVIGTPWPNQEAAFANLEAMTKEVPPTQEKVALSVEELTERKLKALALTDIGVKARYEAIGMTEKFFRAAERFNTLKREHKYAYTGLMVLAGVGSLATGTALAGGAVGAISGALRFVTGVGVFYTKEKQYEKAAEEAGIERTKAERGADRLKAAAWGVTMGGLLSYVLGETARHLGEQTASAIWGGHEAMSHAVKGALAANAPVEAAAAAYTAGEQGVIGTASEISLGQANLAALEHADFDLNEQISIGQANIAENIVPETATENIATAASGDSVWKLAEKQLAAHYGDKFTDLSEAQQTYLIDAVKDKISVDPEHFGIESGDANTLAIGDKVDFKEIFEDKQFMADHFAEAHDLSPEEVAGIEQVTNAEEAASTPEADVSALSETPERVLSTEEAMSYYQPPVQEPALVSPEIMPSDPQVLAYADQQIHNHITSLFGAKGFLGFGAKDGMDSIDWKDPEVGFGDKTVEQIMGAKPNAFPEDGARHFGIESYSATEKMKEYINLAREETGVQPHSGENAEEYIRRAETLAISKFMNKG